VADRSFSGPVEVREVGPGRWQLTSDLIFDGAREQFRVPAGFVTDFASVPRLLWWLVPPFGEHTRSAVLHDWLYHAKVVDRRDADGLFLRCMRMESVPAWRRFAMHAAVRIFGWWAWKT
jgi:hypothetical protein